MLWIFCFRGGEDSGPNFAALGIIHSILTPFFGVYLFFIPKYEGWGKADSQGVFCL